MVFCKRVRKKINDVINIRILDSSSLLNQYSILMMKRIGLKSRRNERIVL